MPKNAIPGPMHPLPLMPRGKPLHNPKSPKTRPNRTQGNPSPGRVDQGVRDRGGQATRAEEGEALPRDQGLLGSDQRRRGAAVELHQGDGDDKGRWGEQGLPLACQQCEDMDERCSHRCEHVRLRVLGPGHTREDEGGYQG